MQLLVKCYDNKNVKSPYNWVISHLTQPQVANKQTKKLSNPLYHICHARVSNDNHYSHCYSEGETRTVSSYLPKLIMLWVALVGGGC